MPKVILQPASNTDARIHFKETISKRVPLSYINSFLSEIQRKDLEEIYPNGTCCIWGITPGGHNQLNWNKIDRGDVTLFSGGGIIFASGTTTYKFHNRELAEKLWGYNPKRETWEYIYFLEEIRELNIPYANFNKIIGYKSNYIIQGFTIPDEGKSLRVIRDFDLESDIFQPIVTDEEYNNIIVQQLEGIDETDASYLAKRRIEQSYLRQSLFGRKTVGTCAICGFDYPIQFLATAHIKKRAFCQIEEKKDFRIVMPTCKFGCDDLYERGYISVQDNKVVELNKTLTTLTLENKLKAIVGNKCTYYNSKTKQYFDWHFEYHSIQTHP